jgi:HPt (histidine-containing phosphotransfer) domain-containing protein
VERIVDQASLLERLGGDQELLAELIESFLADSPQLLEEIGSAEAAGDASQLMRAAHTLKGSVSNFCAPRGAEVAHRLATLGRDANLSQAPEALANVESIMERLRPELQLLASGVSV